MAIRWRVEGEGKRGRLRRKRRRKGGPAPINIACAEPTEDA